MEGGRGEQADKFFSGAAAENQDTHTPDYVVMQGVGWRRAVGLLARGLVGWLRGPGGSRQFTAESAGSGLDSGALHCHPVARTEARLRRQALFIVGEHLRNESWVNVYLTVSRRQGAYFVVIQLLD